MAGLTGLLGGQREAFVPPVGSYLLGVGEQRFVGRLDRIWLTPGLAGHTLIVGQTGSGKTKMIEALCRQFLASGQGFCLLDLHGDLAGELVRFAGTLPAEQRQRFGESLVWLDAADPTQTVTLNPLAASNQGDAATQRLELIAAFRRHWSDSWGPRLAELLTHTLAVLQANGLTLAEVPVFLGDKTVRAKLLAHPAVEPDSRDYFWMRFNPLPKRDQVMMSESTMNKVGALLSDYRVRTLVGDTQPTLDPHEAIAQQQVVLARIPRGVLVENADLLASLLLAAFHTAALSRVALPSAERRPYVMVIDEAQIASETFPQLLSGARAFGLAAVCGLQYLDLVPPSLAEAMLANCQVRICFRTSRRDAERLAPELFRADGDHVKYQEQDLLGSRKSKPIYWSVPEEFEYAIRELQDQGTGECVIQLGRELPWFAETVAVQPAQPDPEALRALGWQAGTRRRRRADVAQAIAARRGQLTHQELTHPKGGDFHDDEDDAIEAVTEI